LLFSSFLVVQLGRKLVSLNATAVFSSGPPSNLDLLDEIVREALPHITAVPLQLSVSHVLQTYVKYCCPAGPYKTSVTNRISMIFFYEHQASTLAAFYLMIVCFGSYVGTNAADQTTS
jgi:hypothetical protein